MSSANMRPFIQGRGGVDMYSKSEKNKHTIGTGRVKF